MTPSQIIHSIAGSPLNPLCSDLDAFICWVCGGKATRGVFRGDWMGSNFTGQNRVRCPESPNVCEACVTVMAGKPPTTERMWTHLVEGRDHVRVNKGSKPVMREFLRRRHAAPWFAAIADSGQKHVIPWAPVNAAGTVGGRVLFEEMLVTVPPTLALVDAMSELLTEGATKEEIERGEYEGAWSRCPSSVRAFELAHEHERHSPWFTLAIWLAQRDEERVQARLQKEKDDAARRKREGKTAKPHRGGAARDPKRVPADVRSERPQALGHDPRAHASGDAHDDGAGGVGHGDSSHAPSGRSQLVLFGGGDGAGERGTRAKVRRGVARSGRA